MKRVSWAMTMLLSASCGRVISSVGEDAGTTHIEAMLTAIEPPIANTDDVIILEGTFDNTVTVKFPGGTSQDATVLGPHRATVSVPIAATDGVLTASTGGTTIGPLPFRRTSFPIGLGMFASNFEQGEEARQSLAPATPRAGHTSVVIGNYLYVLGGVNKGIPLNTVERAMIHANGSLGPFEIVPDVTLAAARYAYTSAVIGDYLYIVGGFDNNNILGSVERAIIHKDGSLGPFATVIDVSLVAARQGHTSTIIGNYLYIFGGAGSDGALSSVERATIHVDGSLDPFMAVPEVQLATARRGHTSAVIGNYLYMIGGFGNNALNTIEQAAIQADGTLGAFATASGVTLATARNSHTSVVLGKHLYVLGGAGSTGTLNSVEQATINADGSLGTFSLIPATILVALSSGHTSAVIGNYIYVLGGLNNNSLNGTQRATINADGLLESFASVPGVALVTARYGHSSTVIGRYLYVIGGISSTTLNSIERAIINIDGTLGSFVTVSGVTLSTPRYYHTSAVIGNYLYVIGGASGVPNSIERAAILTDSLLGPFMTVSGITLATTRRGHTSAIVGNYLYVFGGDGGTGSVLNSVERAPINPNGSLGAFVTVQGITLVLARGFHTSAIVGGYLYVLGGAGTVGASTSVERAKINPDNSLSAFAAVSDVSLKVPRCDHASMVVGSYLYAVGGYCGSGTERTMINTDGSLGSFATVPSVILGTGRHLYTLTMIGNYLYAIGGYAGGSVNSVDRALLGSAAR